MLSVIFQKNKLIVAVYLGYKSLGDDFEETLAYVQFKRELKLVGYTDFDELHRIAIKMGWIK